MSSPAHDPPVRLSRSAPDLTQFTGPRFEKYILIRDRLKPHFSDPEPVHVIERMRLTTGTHVRNGVTLPSFVAFRLIAPELTRLTGVQVTYETLRRWWELAWPNGHPAEVLAERNGPGDLARVARMARQVKPISIYPLTTHGGTAMPQPAVGAIPAAEFLPPAP